MQYMAGAGAGAGVADEIMDKGGAGAGVEPKNNNFGSATLVSTFSGQYKDVFRICSGGGGSALYPTEVLYGTVPVAAAATPADLPPQVSLLID